MEQNIKKKNFNNFSTFTLVLIHFVLSYKKKIYKRSIREAMFEIMAALAFLPRYWFFTEILSIIIIF